MAPLTNGNGSVASLTNYIAYRESNGLDRIGSLNSHDNTIQPLAYNSGTYLRNLYEVIEVGEDAIVKAGEPIQLSSVKLLAPISGRDVLAVGKNYAEHAVEFNSSGYDSSDKTDQPTHPVIFTKRATSIIAHRDDIFPHQGFTETLDYEGEIGVIVGKGGFKISEADAMDHVWGYTIINDVTARERQRDHKQFYIGKSPDTFCPMGPIAVPAKYLNKVLKVQTFVNDEKRQEANTDTLIFSIPFLIRTLSEGITLSPGDVIATGTPAGVGFGQKPPVWLQPGDVVEVKVIGLGTLSNKIASHTSPNPIVSQVAESSSVPWANASKSINRTSGLTIINSKPLYYEHKGVQSGEAVVFVHGLGGTSDFFRPLVSTLGLEDSHSLHFFDLEGHGLSPTRASSKLSIRSFAEDLRGLFQHAGIAGGATLVAHSMGCIVAVDFVLAAPGLVKKLVLIGPPPMPLPEAGSRGAYARATLAREQGMIAVVDAVVGAGTSEKSKTANPLAIAATRMSLLGQDPEGYAKACAALAGATSEMPLKDLRTDTLVITGSEDKVSPPALCKNYGHAIKRCKVAVLPDIGHWHIFEDLTSVASTVKTFFAS